MAFLKSDWFFVVIDLVVESSPLVALLTDVDVFG